MPRSSSKSGRPHRTDFEWLVGQLGKVLTLGESAAAETPDVFHEYGPHTALKLAALNHALDVFTPIAGKQSERGVKYGRSVYVDLFAGCGVTRTEKGDWLAGSPILAAYAKVPFDEMILVESASKRMDALKSRLSGFQSGGICNVTFLLGDCNGLKDKILGLLRPDDLVFVCIDPEGMEIQWETIRSIVAACPASDLFINFTDGVDRVRAVAAADGTGTATIEAFTGKDLAQILSGGEVGGAVLEMYESNLETELGKPFGLASQVKTVSGRALYHVLIRTRRTPRGSPYWPGYEALSVRLKGVSASQASQAIELIKGRQSVL
jgi:three-Cys-motif partner protein